MDKGEARSPLFGSYRSLVSLLTFFGFMNLYMLRIDLSVAIVCMVNHTALRIAAGTNVSEIKFSDCGEGARNVSHDMEDGELMWSKEIQGFTLAAFNWGYLATQLLGGMLSMRFGGKAMFNIAMLGGSVATLLCPVFARIHYSALIALRIVIGLCGGVVFPASFTVFSNWVPPSERSFLIGGALSGSSVGNVVSSILSGYLCRFGFAGGWPSIFYVNGCLGLVCCILWTVLVTDAPRSNFWISKKEALHIENSLEGAIAHSETHVTVPWLKIFTSLPVWASVVSHTFSNMAIYMFLLLLPTYLREVVGFSITENGVLSAIPYIAKALVTLSASFVANRVIAKKLLSRTTTRKIFNSLGQVPFAVLIFATTFLPCSQRGLVVAFLTIGLALTGFHDGSGYTLTPADIAPQFAGIIFAISNTVATIPGIITPSIVGAMTPQRSRLQWNNVFYLISAMCLFGPIFYILFATAELQEWAVPKTDKEEELMMEQLTDGDVKGKKQANHENQLTV